MPTPKKGPAPKTLTKVAFQSRLRMLSGQIKKHKKALEKQITEVRALAEAIEKLIPLVPPGKGNSAKTSSSTTDP